MKIVLTSLFIIALLVGCYQAPLIPGFDKTQWVTTLDDCTEYRSTEGISLLLENESLILSKSQREISLLLGASTHQSLLSRNQKFIFYQLDCENTHELSIRFDALGRVREIRNVLVSK